MITYNVKKSLIFNELDKENQYYFFDRLEQKYLHNIDTFYYVAFLEGDFNNDLNSRNLIEYLDSKRNELLELYDDVSLHEINSKFNMTPLSFSMYQYSIEVKNKYIFFIVKNKINENTPEILVQIRSEHLWLVGEHKAIEDSYLDLKIILDYYNLKVLKTQENRIDFAYHTNYIQDPLNFFKEENLNKMQVSRFTRWHKEGRLVGEDIVECDYLSLGRRKSNNTFLRIYNKSQEVVNQGYKQFFIKIWLLEKMISRFDYYVLEKCFENGSYNYVDRARLEFYLDFGSDNNIKYNIKKLLDKHDTEAIKVFADKITPNLTLIINVELQTKRKFYSSMDESFKILKTVTCKYNELEKIFKIIDNKDLLHSYITNDVIRFVDYNSHTRKKNCNTAVWWKKLQKVNLNNVIDDNNRKLIRQYQKNLDTEKVKKRILNSISTFSIYMKNENRDNIISDTVDFISYLNESDIEKYSKYKKKKSALLKNQVENLESLAIDKSFLLIDSKTAEILN